MNITKIILISLILTTSCDSRVENKLTETFDDKITWNELDEFPSVKDCNNLNESYLIRECFESFLSNQILEKLDLSNVIINKPINDTLTISLLINNLGKVTISEKDIPQNIIENIPNFEILLVNSVDSLPIVLPAIKTNLGITVNSKFKLPIIVKSK